MHFKRYFLIFAVFSTAVSVLSAQDKISREEYILRYKDAAVEHMEIYGIPASVKLAQALLESDDGNSRLAREANNHFGIKCKSNWTGATIGHTDDAPDECFRKYSSAEDSFKDHSEFIDKSERYQDLFKLEPDDYKGWCEGLKKAGYATNPLYAGQLIKIIEDNRLYLLDQGKDLAFVTAVAVSQADASPASAAAPEQAPPPVTASKPSDIVDVDNYVVSVESHGGSHTVYHNNGSKFVIAEEGDTYASIASEFGVGTAKVYKFNDVAAGAPLRKGDMVYVKAKNKRSENGKLIHIAKDGETMHYISQLYGIKLANLYSINRRPKDSELKSGQQIRLM